MKNLYIKIATNEVKYYSFEKRAVIFAILFKIEITLFIFHFCKKKKHSFYLEYFLSILFIYWNVINPKKKRI